ncbi:MAG: hypothetical protein KJ906_01985 [Nanoarchaeota archaeon]|nr:hypothetical protein [Nanoarchaeota archaeon]
MTLKVDTVEFRSDFDQEINVEELYKEVYQNIRDSLNNELVEEDDIVRLEDESENKFYYSGQHGLLEIAYNVENSHAILKITNYHAPKCNRPVFLGSAQRAYNQISEIMKDNLSKQSYCFEINV